MASEEGTVWLKDFPYKGMFSVKINNRDMLNHTDHTQVWISFLYNWEDKVFCKIKSHNYLFKITTHLTCLAVEQTLLDTM